MSGGGQNRGTADVLHYCLFIPTAALKIEDHAEKKKFISSAVLTI